jgi:hypothetical protein
MAEKSKSKKAAAPAAGTAGQTFGPGDFVTNPLKPEWGPGRVVDLKRDVVFVYFRDRPGKEVIRMKQNGLRPGDRDPELEAISGYVETASGFAVEKKKGVKLGAKPKKNARPVIVFEDIADDIEAEIADLDLEEMDVEDEE